MDKRFGKPSTDEEQELTFPDCPTCARMKDSKCPVSDKCKVAVQGGVRYGTPSHWFRWASELTEQDLREYEESRPGNLISRSGLLREFEDLKKQAPSLRDAIYLDGVMSVIDNAPAVKQEIVHCFECKHLYFKDMSAFCPHRVNVCHPDGFCDRGEKRDGEDSAKGL